MDSERDFWPPPVRTCPRCDRKFVAEYWNHRVCCQCQEEEEETMKKYTCHQCGVQHSVWKMWIWDDDTLLCGACTNKRIDRLEECLREKQTPDAVNAEGRGTERALYGN